MKLQDDGFFKNRGLEILVFCNWYDGLFSDAKMAGVEFIHHGVRTVTNGDVRLKPTPGQWDPVPKLTDRRVDHELRRVDVVLEYPYHDFRYTLQAEASDGGVVLRVILSEPLPAAFEGRAGLNIELLPSAFFSSSFYADGKSGSMPRYPSGSMENEIRPLGIPVVPGYKESLDPKPFASGGKFVFAPENPLRTVIIESADAVLNLYDGRHTAQNGWFVVRSLIPPGKTGTVLEWRLSGSVIPDWVREPVVAHSQVGYHPSQKKTAFVELDPNDTETDTVRLLSVGRDGGLSEVHTGGLSVKKRYLRYDYAPFDFSHVRQEGLYVLESGRTRTAPFRISEDVYEAAWHPALDIFLPVQMDHMFVREAFRVWHGASHLDDARQAPAGQEHFDLYAMSVSTDTKFKDGEHIPGLDVGGWYDAGDFDIRTQTQYAVILDLVHTWERFRPLRDETTVDQERRYVEIHVPDGIPDIIQQIEHGALALLAQYRAVGHAIAGIVEPDLEQYTHLGDASTKTDNKIYDPTLKHGEVKGGYSGTPDDRWAFTSKSTPLDYGSAAALAAAARALAGYRTIAAECLETAEKVWTDEHAHPPYVFRFGNTTGGILEDEEFKAAVELLAATKNPLYAGRIRELEPILDRRFLENARTAVYALPYMDADYGKRLEERVVRYADTLSVKESENPFMVPITRGGWAGNGAVVLGALLNYELHKAFPDLISPESVYSGLNYLFGCHPESDISFVSGVGARSKETAYGNNRADFSFIAGGVVPGLLILNPDFPENKEDWPFLWGENEYVVNMSAAYIYLVLAVNDLLSGRT